ncbi:MAG: PQQ-binding-like beta-propeller repeat protein [Nitrospirota bacterium]
MKNQVKKEEELSLAEKKRYKLRLLFMRSFRWIILLWLLVLSQIEAKGVSATSNPWPMLQHDSQRSGETTCIGIKDPLLKWSYFANSCIFASSVIDRLGKIYLVTEDGNLHIISLSGKKEKIISIGVKIDSTPAISKDGYIYVNVSDGHVLCFNSSYERQWVYDTKSRIKTSSIALSDDGIIFTGTEDGILHAINKDGSPKWQYQTESSIQSSPAISHEGIIYIGCEDGSLHAINSDGSLRFKKDVAISTFSSPAIDSEGNVYIGSSNKILSVITKDGEIFSIPIKAQIYSSPTVSKDGSVYIGTDEGLFRITKKGVWCAKTGKIFNCAPAISYDGIIYVASFDGRIHAVNSEGKIIWSYEIGFGPTSLAIDQNGNIYVGSRDRNLYAIGSWITPKAHEEVLPQVPKIVKRVIEKVEEAKKEVKEVKPIIPPKPPVKEEVVIPPTSVAPPKPPVEEEEVVTPPTVITPSKPLVKEELLVPPLPIVPPKPAIKEKVVTPPTPVVPPKPPVKEEVLVPPTPIAPPKLPMEEKVVATLPPLPPTNLQLVPISQSEIKLSWNDNSNNEQGFKLERALSLQKYVQIKLLPANTTSYIDKGLKKDTRYSYRIKAYNSVDSDYLDEASVRTLDVLPALPTNLTGVSNLSTQIKLSWCDNSDNEVGFKLERKLKSELAYTQIAILNQNIGSYQDFDLTPNTTYCYRVRTYNCAGNSEYSNLLTMNTSPVIPFVPTGLKCDSISSNQINLSWSDNSDNELGFKLERKTERENYKEIGVISTNITTCEDKSLSPNTTYYYRLRAFNQGGNSSYSNEQEATTKDTIPYAPSGLLSKPISTTQIDLYHVHLSWQDNSNNEQGFKIERRGKITGYTQIAILLANTTTYQDKNLVPDTTYYYRLKAYNSLGDSDYSNEQMQECKTLDVVPTIPILPVTGTLVASPSAPTAPVAPTHPASPKPEPQIQPMDISPYSGIESPRLSWTYPTNAKIYRSNPAIDAQGRIYVGSEDASLYCLSSEGNLIWSYPTKGGINTAPAIGEDGEVYIVSGDKNLYALLPNGTLKWKYPVKFPVEASVVIAPNFTIHVFTSNGNIYSIHPDGRLRWMSYLGGGMITQTPVIDAHGNIYIGASGPDGGLFCLDSKGALKWKYTESGEATTSPAVDVNENVYIGLNNALCCFNPDGVLQWTIKPKKMGWTKFSPVVGINGVIYYNLCWGSQEGDLIAIKQDGKILWEYPVGWSTFSPKVDSAGNIYASSNSYNLSCILPDGKLKWNWTIDSMLSTSPDIGKDGTIYVGASNGQLYALGKGDKSPIAPDNLMVKAVSSSQINITWSDNSNDESGFVIERGVTAKAYSELAVLPYNINSYQDEDILPLTTYYYRVKAFNQTGATGTGAPDKGNSDYSNSVYAKTLDMPPSCPTLISIISLKPGDDLKLSWQNPKEKTFSHLTIYRSIVKNKLGTLIADGLKATTWLDTDLVNKLSYYYTFVAVDIYGNKSLPSIQYVGVPMDNLSPTVTGNTPIGEKVSTELPITITFSEEMHKESIKEAVSITPMVTGTFTWEGNKLIWTPISDLSGSTKYTVKISTKAKDLESNHLQKSFIWQFTTFNPSPIIWSYAPLDLSPKIYEGDSLAFAVSAADPNHEKLRYSWKLNGIEKSTSNSWTYIAGHTDAGTKTITLRVADGTSVVLKNWFLTVIEKNIPPRLIVIDDTTININELLQFNVSANDEDNDQLTYTVSNLPHGAIFSLQTKIFTWHPAKEQGGTYEISFKVSDGRGGEDIKKVKIHVNHPPRME